MAMTRDGHEITCVEDGAIALAAVTANPRSIDLLITDHHVPHLTGLELVTALRRQEFPGKIMVFSSELSSIVGTAYLHLAVDRILPKPIFPSELRRVIAELFPAPSPAR